MLYKGSLKISVASINYEALPGLNAGSIHYSFYYLSSMKTENYLLPGLERQIEFLFNNFKSSAKNILVIGSNCEEIAKELSNHFEANIDVIVEDYDSLINSKLLLESAEKINVRLMDFEVTDFEDSSFDLIYAQAAISVTKRNKIVKEINRLLKPDGYMCLGEMVTLRKDYPPFVQDIFDSSDLLPLFVDDLEKYYTERKFTVLVRQNLTHTLKNYYSSNIRLLDRSIDNLTSSEKSYYKKILNKLSHESNAYLKLGGDKFIGFIVLLLQKGLR
jgi:ubiquinone/menaquinone biosynthesis C-methylase UbiE